ncbi:methylated-DNA--[protein]-cysteine S-methyltransferase [Candidatus Neomicrothrix sp.]|uniref:Methylated-DNA--protein-cysteine methyltransferase n=1 Tax=Candidatus Neomicrothrix subdominans TaxID=2954438 RepID=A0A936TEA0_9ACTN|nr:methylated-DNA--[protein]-cysteine S-methyltransferase [Candidatus Microthrix subdominans]
MNPTTDSDRNDRGTHPTVSRVIDTPIGPLTLVADDVGLRAVTWPDEDGARVGLSGQLGASDSSAPSPTTVHSSAAIATLEASEAQLREYFAGERQDFDLPMHLVGTDFQQEAWRGLADIPYGQTISYGEQAERLGRPKAVRAVGAANGRNPLSIVLPCHRVVGASGDLTGFAAGLETKRWLLAHESDQAPLPFA